MTSRLLTLSDRLVRYAAVALLLTLLATVVAGVVSRQLNAPLAWTDELAQYLLVWTGFTGWIIAARRRWLWSRSISPILARPGALFPT